MEYQDQKSLTQLIFTFADATNHAVPLRSPYASISPRGRYQQVTFEPLIAGVHPIATRMLLVVKVYGAKGMENIGEV